MKHLTLVALIFSMLVAVAISGCVVRDHYYRRSSLASLGIMFLIIDYALKRAALSILKVSLRFRKEGF